MVRAVDSNMVFFCSKTPGEANVFEVNDIPGLRTREMCLKNLYLDDLNITVVNLHLPQRASPSLREYCYVLSGGKSLSQLGGEVASRLKLCSCYLVQFSFDSIILSEDTKVSTLYKEYQSADGFLDLSCTMVPKLPTVAPYKEYRKICKTCYFNVLHKAKVPIIAPVYLNEEVVPFPPFRIRNIRDAKKAAAAARTGSYGDAIISHGSYSDEGHLQFY